MKPWMEVRGGHLWCTKHDCWWKDAVCDCPGDVQVTVTITQEIIDACAPKH